MIQRRKCVIRRVFVFFSLLSTVVLLTVSFAEAQQAEKVYLIGYMALGDATLLRTRVTALRQGLLELGYLEGKNIIIEERYGQGNADRYRKHAKELVELNPNVIVVHGDPTTAKEAAWEAGKTIPIVMAVISNPVERGIIDSLARPGGSITGLSRGRKGSSPLFALNNMFEIK